ncbi:MULTISPECIES: arsenical resistance protein ArsH [Cysteiniphilum]|uniref:arsenical resistance protein ArsH n=1 Tax=Cysteiniphilum TaxID=2056696 RepID=UPI001939A237|nr:MULTISPECIES: arsenical resistance protein ArsH [Cysteiniphilum]
MRLKQANNKEQDMTEATLPNHSITSVRHHLYQNHEQIRAPRILFLYGSLRTTSYSRLLAEESMRIISTFGAEAKIFHPHTLPLADIGLTQSPDETLLPESVQYLRQLIDWCDAMVWVSPEVHGSISSVLKNVIDWMPLSIDAVRPTQGKLLALMQVNGGSQSFNTLTQMRTIGRWMRMITIPNQSSVAMAYKQFNDDGTMKLSNYRDRVIDVMEELFKYCLLFQGKHDFLHDRYSEQEDTKNQAKEVTTQWRSAAESLT